MVFLTVQCINSNIVVCQLKENLSYPMKILVTTVRKIWLEIILSFSRTIDVVFMIWRWGYVFQALSWWVAGLLVDGFSWCCCIFLVCFCWNGEPMVLVSSFSKRTCREAVAAVYVNLIASALTWFHLFMEEKEIQGRVMWFSASISSCCTKPHNHLKGNRNKEGHGTLWSSGPFVVYFIIFELAEKCLQSHAHGGWPNG